MKTPNVITRLKGLMVNEVSLVDRPANQHARVLLAKRDETTTDDEVEKAGYVCEKCDKPMQKGATCACGGKAVQKSLPKVEETIIKTQTETSMKPGEKPTTEVLKSLPDAERAAIEKQLADGEAARVELEKLRKDATEREAVHKAKSIVGKVNVKPEDIASVLKQLDAAGQAVVEDLLAKHNAALEAKGGVLGEIGSTAGEDQTTAETKLEKAAEALRKADPKLTYAAAITKALEQEPSLYEDEDEEVAQ